MSLSVCVYVNVMSGKVQGALMLKVFISDFEQNDGQSCGAVFFLLIYSKIY